MRTILRAIPHIVKDAHYGIRAVPLLAIWADSIYRNGMAGLDHPPASIKRFTGVLLRDS